MEMNYSRDNGYKIMREITLIGGQDFCDGASKDSLKTAFMSDIKVTAAKVATMTLFVVAVLVFATIITQGLRVQPQRCNDVHYRHQKPNDSRLNLSTSIQHLFKNKKNQSINYDLNNAKENVKKRIKNNNKNNIGIELERNNAEYHDGKPTKYIEIHLKLQLLKSKIDSINNKHENINIMYERERKIGNKRKIDLYKKENILNTDNNMLNLKKYIKNVIIKNDIITSDLHNNNSKDNIVNRLSHKYPTRSKDYKSFFMSTKMEDYIHNKNNTKINKRFKRSSREPTNNYNNVTNYYNQTNSYNSNHNNRNNSNTDNNPNLNDDNENDEEDDEESGDGLEESGCCGYKEGVKQSRLEGIKSDILQQLRLSTPPKVHAIDEQFIHTIIQQNNAFSSQNIETSNDVAYLSHQNPMTLKADDDLAATNRMFCFCEDLPHPIQPNGQLNFYCFFRFNDIIRRNNVKNATMSVYINKLNGQRDLMNNYSSRTSRLHREAVLIESINIDRTVSYVQKKLIKWDNNKNGAWLEFDIGPKIIEWQNNPHSNHGLKISIETTLRSSHSSPSFSLVAPNSTNNSPSIDLFLVEKPREENRHKRELGNEKSTTVDEDDDLCQEDTKNKGCCRFPLMVNFTEFEWNFIVHPKHYQAYYCAGYCGAGFRQSSIHSHLVEETVRSYSTDSSANGLCCAPRSFAPLQILYVDEENTALSEVISSMVVKRCGCF